MHLKFNKWRTWVTVVADKEEQLCEILTQVAETYSCRDKARNYRKYKKPPRRFQRTDISYEIAWERRRRIAKLRSGYQVRFAVGKS